MISMESPEAPIFQRPLCEVIKARSLARTGHPRKALELLRKLDRSTMNRRWPYHACLSKLALSQVAQTWGDFRSARIQAHNALRLSRAMPSRHLEAQARLLLACSRFRSLNLPRANATSDDLAPGTRDSLPDVRSELSRSLELAEQAGARELRWRALHALALVARRLGANEECVKRAGESLDCIRSLETSVPKAAQEIYRNDPERSVAIAECEQMIREMPSPRADALPQDAGMEQEHLRHLFRMSSSISSIRDLPKLLDTILSCFIEATQLDQACIFLSQGEPQALEVAHVKGPPNALRGMAQGVNLQILDSAIRDRSPFLTTDAAADGRTSRQNESLLKPSGTIFCMPLLTAGAVLGALYGSHPDPRENMSESTINFLAAFCGLSAAAIENAKAHRILLDEKAELERHLQSARDGMPEMVGGSAIVRSLRERIALAAASPLDVLIMGESGTGKEIVAHALHRLGRRASKSFFPLDCGSLSDSLVESELFGFCKGAFTGATSNKAGLFEAAEGGILFLDEISNLSPKLQGKLLRVLQEREVRRIGETRIRKIDVRVIAATNKNLPEEVRRGAFRKDLFYRLNAMVVVVPPLRDRLEDVPDLVERFLQSTAELQDGKRKTFSPEAMRYLCRYPYPGNVRDLYNVVQGAYFSCTSRIIGPEHLDPRVTKFALEPLRETLSAKSIYDGILGGNGTFDDLVKDPYLRRQIPSSTVRRVLEKALVAEGGNYRNALRSLAVPDDKYAITLQFLKRHDCYLDFRSFRKRLRSKRSYEGDEIEPWTDTGKKS